MKNVITLVLALALSLAATAAAPQASEMAKDSAACCTVTTPGLPELKPLSAAALKTISTLTGVWENTIQPVSLPITTDTPCGTGFLSIELGADGRFAERLHNGSETIALITGTWSVSEDGTALLLTPDRQPTAPRTIAISYLQMDELVLASRTMDQDAPLSKDYYFNRR